MWHIFKEESNYPEFMHVRMASLPIYFGYVEF